MPSTKIVGGKKLNEAVVTEVGALMVDVGQTINVIGALTDAQLRASPIPVVGTLPAGAATEITLAQIKAKTDNLDVALSTRTKPADQQHVIIDSIPPVTGTFFQATQPVSLASAPTTPVTGPLTDSQLRASMVPVSGTFFQATQPVSLAVAPTTPVTGPLTDAQLRATPVPTRPVPATLAVTVTAAANTAVTLTLPAPGVGLFHYITYLNITKTATAALTGNATQVITSTNLPGTWAHSCGNAMVAGGTQVVLDQSLPYPLKSSVANTATTIVMPAPGAAVLWRAFCHYYVA